MSANASHKIMLKKRFSRHFLEYACSAILSPGHLVEVQSDNTIKKQSVLGGRGSRLIAYEDVHKGSTINDAFAVNDQVPVYAYDVGDEMMLRVAAGTAAIVEGQDLAGDGAGGVLPIPANGALYQNTAASTAITNTTSATPFNLSYTYPANTLQVGDAIRITLEGSFPSTNSTDTCTIAVLFGATTILTLAALDVANNDIFRIEIDAIVRSISGTTATVSGSANYGFGTPGTATDKSAAISFTFNNTVTQAVTVQATWSAASASDQVVLNEFQVSGRSFVSLFKAIDAVDNSGGSADVFISGRAL